MARIRFEKEKAKIKANDPKATTPMKKRGRPADPKSLRQRMIDLHKEYEDSMMEDEDDSKGETENREDEFMDPEEWR